MTEADGGLGLTPETLKAESEARIAQLFPGQGAAEQTAKAESAGEKAESAKPEGQPAEAPKPDLSWLPEELAAHAAALPAEVVEKLKPHVLRQADYTRKTQEVAKQRKDAEAALSDAEAYRFLVQDPRRAEVVLALLNGKVPTAEAAEAPKPFSWGTASDEEIEREIERRVESKADARARQVLAERVEGPISHAKAIRDAVATHYEDVKEQVPEPAYRAAWEECRAYYGDGELTKLRPDAVVRVFQPFVEKKALEARLEALQSSKPKASSVARASSSPGTVGVGTAVKVDPWAGGRKPTDSEKAEALARSLSQMLGREVSLSEIEKAGDPYQR